MSDIAERQAWIEITRLLIDTLWDLAPQPSANDLQEDLSLELKHVEGLLRETAHKRHLSKKYLDNGAFEKIFYSTVWV